MKKWLAIGSSVLVIAIGGFAVMHKVSPISWGWWGDVNTSSGLAINGYDPVAYFTIKQPIHGDSRFTFDWSGATWQFATAENRDLFAHDPESYAPQFGGFCAFAVSKGLTADSSPIAWYVDKGNLYLFADDDVEQKWVAAISDGSIDASVANWAKR